MATKKDFTQVAHAVFMQATGAAPKPKKAIAGRSGGLVGGKKRMESLTPEQRLELSARGVAARKKATALRTGAKITK